MLQKYFTHQEIRYFPKLVFEAQCVIELYNCELSQLLVVAAAAAAAAAGGKTTPIVMQCLLLLLLLYCVMSASFCTVQCLLLPSSSALLWIPAIRLVSPMFGELVMREHYHT